MKNVVYSLIIICAIGGIVYTYEPLRTLILPPPAPCTIPILYSIGTFDGDFKVSKDEFLRDIDQSAAIWNKALGRTLLKYDVASELKINLIYDYRQGATNKQNAIDDVIHSGKAEFDVQKLKYESLSNSYTEEKTRLESARSAYTRDLNAYNDQVASWNARGGAPKGTYEDLQLVKQNLSVESKNIEAERLALNQKVSDLNKMASDLNVMAKNLNINVKAYNTIGASIGDTFNEGEFIRDGSTSRINVFEFKDDNQLRRLLAHEFGHALGLEHVDDPRSIMYYLNDSANTVPTDADLGELETVCNVSTK